MNSIIFLTCIHMSSFGFLCILVTQSVQISRDRKFSRPWHHERVQFDLAQWAGPRWCVRQVYSHEWTSDHASGKVPDGKNLFYSCCYQAVCWYAYKKWNILFDVSLLPNKKLIFMDMCSINICYGVVHILKLLYNCKKSNSHSQKPTKKHLLMVIVLVLVLMARFK